MVVKRCGYIFIRREHDENCVRKKKKWIVKRQQKKRENGDKWLDLNRLHLFISTKNQEKSISIFCEFCIFDGRCHRYSFARVYVSVWFGRQHQNKQLKSKKNKLNNISFSRMKETSNIRKKLDDFPSANGKSKTIWWFDECYFVSALCCFYFPPQATWNEQQRSLTMCEYLWHNFRCHREKNELFRLKENVLTTWL